MDDRLRRAAQGLSDLRGQPCLVLNTGLDRPTAYRLYTVIGRASGKALDVIVNSPGGDIEAAYLLVRQMQKRFEVLTGFVPFWAKSAATLLCLGMDELVMGEFGELGPLDAQVDESQPGGRPVPGSALNRFKAIEQAHMKALEFFNSAMSLILRQAGVDIPTAVTMAIPMTKAVSDPLLSQISPDRLGESARALEVGKQYATRILKTYHGWDDLRTAKFVDALVTGYPSHGFIIDLEELGRLGFDAREPTDEESPFVEELMRALLSQGTSKQTVVELLMPGGGQAAEEAAAGQAL